MNNYTSDPPATVSILRAERWPRYLARSTCVSGAVPGTSQGPPHSISSRPHGGGATVSLILQKRELRLRKQAACPWPHCWKASESVMSCGRPATKSGFPSGHLKLTLSSPEDPSKHPVCAGHLLTSTEGSIPLHSKPLTPPYKDAAVHREPKKVPGCFLTSSSPCFGLAFI